jgi:hypothetical protein
MCSCQPKQSWDGDLLADLVAQVGTYIGEGLRGEILAEIAARANVSESDIHWETGSLPIQKGPANWE